MNSLYLSLHVIYCNNCLTDIVACRSVALQWLQNNHLYNSHCQVMTPQTSKFPWQQENAGVMIEMFSIWSTLSVVSSASYQMELLREPLGIAHCELLLLLLQAGRWGLRQFENSGEREHHKLEAANKQRQ